MMLDFNTNYSIHDIENLCEHKPTITVEDDWVVRSIICCKPCNYSIWINGNIFLTNRKISMIFTTVDDTAFSIWNTSTIVNGKELNFPIIQSPINIKILPNILKKLLILL